MKKQLILIGTIILLVCVNLTGCTDTNTDNTDEAKLIGTWESSVGEYIVIMEFGSDHTFTVSRKLGEQTDKLGSGTWKITNNKILIIQTEPSKESTTLEYIFSNNDNTLTATDENGEVQVLNRK